ncbi:F0F1 ATP synthase subunit A [Verminephrobacter aporrectodeae]|uniref:ATP synthase subunit a n=1 Tax=Verminephrobacter aporrectodeae subsp. tuberculatae TaxID=1110392 RepID=A0ABT3KUP1_9BURK|nr:F0F1 ATP synthase subunit A [Verminephrobacter aporrectodeae]MCW5223015.1 F0F1 ATP synthase subunit A [Verminephrobacter aporrectodeae subsp. tuberculatae]MCW5256770.1 F0F1 ATP synthase subunit A [Verminephrobacter aporrectodeae subsp. tuberculatae]MCW5288479.1 F0F1 ATP synthase subunit A [Verminephrobacter aporrectodeae subsp. tuberculatae]MCW5322062.1 F0F1 ATP synthase subunit A [Verminephrobacter aporrectodeae subsp. tuberculatae]MCW8166350.1 F0F1 ATP synthase subunit A [Verminephrobacte
MAEETHALTASEYITHHLQHLQNTKQTGIIDFSVINYDSVAVGLLLGLLALFVLWSAARKASSGVPGRFQAAVEILVEMVDHQAKAIIHNAESRRFIAPLGLTVFVWIFLMNFMDMLPVDLLPAIWAGVYGAAGHDPGHAYLRVVPTADLSTTLGLALAVLLLRFWYSVKIKGAGGWAHELVSAPFGTSKHLLPALILGLINLLMQIIEYVANTVSHGMRLFGNMYAGELVFMLIALMGGAAALSLSGVLLPVGHIIAGTIWTLFHILVISLQAFIFMMLALIYLGQAHNAH